MKPVFSVARDVGIVTTNHHVKRSLVAFFYIVLAGQYSWGTSIVVLQSGSTIWVAADSQESDQTGTIFRSACKITREGNFYWAAAGPVYSDPQTGFEVSNLVGAVRATRGTIRTKLKVFIAKSAIPIERELYAIRKDDPASFANLITYKSLLQVVFVGRKNRYPTFAWASLISREVNGHIVVSGTTEEPLKNQGIGVLGIGETVHALDYIHNHANEIITDPVGVIRNSIVAEEQMNGRMVGGKISVLRVSGMGAGWEEKGECH